MIRRHYEIALRIGTVVILVYPIAFSALLAAGMGAMVIIDGSIMSGSEIQPEYLLVLAHLLAGVLGFIGLVAAVFGSKSKLTAIMIMAGLIAYFRRYPCLSSGLV